MAKLKDNLRYVFIHPRGEEHDWERPYFSFSALPVRQHQCREGRQCRLYAYEQGIEQAGGI